MKLSEGIRRELEYAHLNLDLSTVDWEKLRDPFAGYYSVEYYEKIIKAIRDPRNFWFTCKYLLGLEVPPIQLVCLEELWVRPFPMLIASRGFGKTWILAMYVLLRLLITQGCRIVITSASFRQAKFVLDYCQQILNNAPVYKDLTGTLGVKVSSDVLTLKVGDSIARAVPLGDGRKIRGYRANYILAEEFSSIPQTIFEEVVSGFAASASSPIENMKRLAQIELLKKKGMYTKKIAEEMEGAYKPNQVIISGTASWDFNHFAKYWKEYRGIIQSKGNPEKLHNVMGDRWSPELDWKDYSIIRIPLELIPPGMMDEKNIARSKAGSSIGVADNEYSCIFSKDSAGFFPRKLIESCVCKHPILLGNELVQFSHRMHGDTSRKYVLSCDPASESDNFAIVIVELCENHIRVVYCWTTTRKRAMKRFGDKETKENSFYTYAARKIRELLKLFPIEIISLDSGGGGIEVMSALHDLRRLEGGEIPIWPIRQDHNIFWPGSKDWGYDDEAGLHMIEMVSMSKSDYVVEANHALKRALENKTLIFPQADAVTLMTADMQDTLEERTYDTLEDVVMEVEEMKEELATITHETSPNGRDKWVTPEIILPGNKRGRMRKDRYSALMMGHFAAIRLMKLTTIHHQVTPAGGFASMYKDKDHGGMLYSGPSWFTDAANKSMLGMGVTKENPDKPAWLR